MKSSIYLYPYFWLFYFIISVVLGKYLLKMKKWPYKVFLLFGFYFISNIWVSFLIVILFSLANTDYFVNLIKLKIVKYALITSLALLLVVVKVQSLKPWLIESFMNTEELSFLTYLTLNLIALLLIKTKVENQVMSQAYIYPLSLISGPLMINAQKTKKNFKKYTLLFFFGFFQKFFISNYLWDFIKNRIQFPHGFNKIELILVVLTCKIYIYTAISGFTLMVNGLCGLIGIKTIINFNKPFHANNILHFWQRWQISVTTWIKLFLIPPILKNKWLVKNLFILLVINFAIISFWHGFKLHFFVYGLLQAIMIWIYIRLIRNSQVIFFRNSYINKALLYVFCLSIPSVLFLTDSIQQFIDVFVKYNINAGIYYTSVVVHLLLVFTVIFFENHGKKLYKIFINLSDTSFQIFSIIIIYFFIIFSSNLISDFLYSRL